jgi:hypothetical protein
MTAGWFALGGVVIGGLLNGFVSWLLGRSTLRADARVAALLVIEELMQSMPAMLQLGKLHTWGALNLAHDFGKREAWEQNRATLGHALHPDGYMTLAAAYSGLAGAAERAAREPSTGKPSEEEGMSVATTYLTMNRGLSYLGVLVHQRRASTRGLGRSSGATVRPTLTICSARTRAIRTSWPSTEGQRSVFVATFAQTQTCALEASDVESADCFSQTAGTAAASSSRSRRDRVALLLRRPRPDLAVARSDASWVRSARARRTGRRSK